MSCCLLFGWLELTLPSHPPLTPAVYSSVYRIVRKKMLWQSFPSVCLCDIMKEVTLNTLTLSWVYLVTRGCQGNGLTLMSAK